MAGVNRVAPIITGQSNAQTIKGSLRFESGKYLSRTFSTGNANTWTWSGWIKRGNLSTTQYPFRTPSVDEGFYFSTSDKIDVYRYTGSFTYFGTTPAVFRDNGGWYHVVYVHDSTQPTGSRLRFYINGVLQGPLTSFTDIASSTGYSLNSAVAHRLGEIDGYMSNVTFIDGQALGPGFFGFTDPLTGTWRPKRLKDGAPTANDGRTWSGDLTATSPGGYFNPSYPATNAFNGNLASSAVAEPNDGEITWAPSGGIQVNATIEIYRVSNPGTSFTASVNGGSSVNFKDGQWVDLGFSGNLRTLVITASGSQNPQISGIRVDGVVLVDATTTNVDFGTNGFYLPLDDQDDYTTDKSGKGNDWTANGFTGTSSNPDVVPDSPSGVVGSTKPTSGITTTSSITKPTNYATFNALITSSTVANARQSFADGNLKLTSNTSGNYGTGVSIIPVSSGKWYCEFTYSRPGGSDPFSKFGLTSTSRNFFLASNNQLGGQSIDHVVGFTASATNYQSADTNQYTYTSGGISDGDVIMLAYDATAGKLWFGQNGTWLTNASGTGDPSTGTNPDVSGLSGEKYLGASAYSNGTSNEIVANFGQRPFKYQPPAGFLTICSANVRPSTVVTRPGDYVGIATYNGSGATQSMYVGIKPDLVWIKSRAGATAYEHLWFDTVRGATKYIKSNSTALEQTNASTLSSFNSDGFTLGGDNEVNRSAHTYVAWAWKAGGSSNTFNIDGRGYSSAADAGLDGGTVTVTGASVNTKTGFSIIKYSGDGTNTTVSHGLGRQPKWCFIKNLTDNSYWITFHDGYTTQSSGDIFTDSLFNIGDKSAGVLNLNDVTYVNSSYGMDFLTNASGKNYIAYLWADVPGLQKFGQYIGNLSTDGPFVELGFRPAILLCRSTTAGNNWFIKDNTRTPFNPVDRRLYPNANNNEMQQVTYHNVDFLSNGFKLRGDGSEDNANGDTILYAAWAEAPAFNLYGGQSLAR